MFWAHSITDSAQPCGGCNLGSIVFAEFSTFSEAECPSGPIILYSSAVVLLYGN